jgi:hypothetical protein
VVVSPLNVTLPEQYPVEGKRLFLRTQMPPLPLPVDASTPDNLLNTQFAYETITHVQPDRLRLAWEYAVSGLERLRYTSVAWAHRPKLTATTGGSGDTACR